MSQHTGSGVSLDKYDGNEQHLEALRGVLISGLIAGMQYQPSLASVQQTFGFATERSMDLGCNGHE